MLIKVSGFPIKRPPAPGMRLEEDKGAVMRVMAIIALSIYLHPNNSYVTGHLLSAHIGKLKNKKRGGSIAPLCSFHYRSSVPEMTILCTSEVPS